MNRCLRFLLLALVFAVFSTIPVVAEDSSEANAEPVQESVDAAAEAAAAAAAAAEAKRVEEAARAKAEAEAAATAKAEAARKAAAEEAARLAEEEKQRLAEEEAAANDVSSLKTKVASLVDSILSESKSFLETVKDMSPATVKKVAAAGLGAWGVSLAAGYISKNGAEKGVEAGVKGKKKLF